MARNVFSSPRMEVNRLDDMRSKDGHKLYVRMTSHPLDVEQLLELFQEHGKVLDIFVSEKKWAFVTFEDKRDAQNAVITISRSNLPLQVSFALEGAKRSSRRSDAELICTNVRNVGRGHILNNPYFDGRHRPGMFEEAVFQDDLEEPYFPNIQCTVDERGQRILKGTGFSEASDRRSSGWNPYRSDLDAPPHHLSEDEACKHCNRPASKECGLCAMPYCSRKCQLQDYHRHRLECVVPPLVYRKPVVHLEEILKEDNAMSKSQKGRNKDASNKLLEKDNRRNTDKCNDNSTVSRNHKSKQDSPQNQKDGTKKNNIEKRSQNGSESLRNGREKDSPSNSKHQNQEFDISMATTAQDSERTRESAGNHAKGHGKRKLPSNRFTEDIPPATDCKQKHQEVGNSRAARQKVKDSETTRESRTDTVEANEKRKLPSDRFTEVIITVPVGPVTYWVQSTETLQMSLDVHGAVSTVGANATDSCEPKIGELYVAPFQGDWYRAKVISLQPKLRVLFVDYGNEDICSPTDIKKLPESCKSIPYLAFRIKLVPGTSKEYHNLNADTQFKVKPVESVKENDAVVVCVEGDEPQSESAVKYKYALQKLKEGEHGIGKIIKPVNEEDTLVLALTESTKEDYVGIMDELLSKLPVDDFKPKIGDLVAAEAEERGLLDCQWGRAIILGVRHDKYLVNFVDHCLVLRTKNVRKLSREVADIPGFGTKLTILEYKKPVNGNWTQFFKSEGKFPFTVEEVNRNKNVTVAINKGEEKVCRAILSGWNPISDPNTVCLKNGTEVIIVFFDLEFIYVRPVSVSYMQMFDDLEEDLCKHCETASQLSSMPALKSVIACKYGQNSTYYRAQVIDIFKDIIKVYFVDYGNEDAVKLESLKPLSDDLRLYPFLAEKIPLKHLTERDLTAEGTRLLLELSEEKAKLKVRLSSEVPSGIELVMENRITLNKKLNTFFAKNEKRELVHAPKKEIATTEHKTESLPTVEPQSKSSPAAESKSSSSSLTTHSVPSASTDKIYRMDEDLEYEGLPIGKTVELLVLHKFNETDFTCCRRDSTALTDCIGTLQEEMTAYCSTCEEEYRPKEIGELCLAKFEDDGMWYRAVCIENTDDSAQKVKIVFVDFGNAADVAISHIRRMVAEYLKTPAVAHLCTIKGAEQMSEAKKDAIGRLVETSRTYPASIIEKKSSSYVIEMLHVTKAVSSMN